MRNLTVALRWVGHPGTVAAVVLLLVNDHLLKAAWPGAVTGKLSDIAGLVVAPAVLAGALALILPVRRRWPLVEAGVIGTGLGFVLVKLTASGAQVASAVWSAVAGPSRVLADPTDLMTLPALGLAWWIGRRTAVARPTALPPGGPEPAVPPDSTGPQPPHRPTAGAARGHRRLLLRRVRVLVAAPLALFAVTATSTDGEPDPDPRAGVAERPATWSSSLPAALGVPQGAAVSGDRVVVVTEPGGMATLDRRTGQLRWQQEPSSSSQRWRRIRVTRDAVLIFLDNAVQILDPSTGALVREVAPVTGATASWTTLFLTTCEPRCVIQAQDVRSGRLVWTHARRSGSERADEPAYWTDLSTAPGEPARDRLDMTRPDRLHPLVTPESRVLLAGQYQGGGVYRTLALDAGTGKVLSEGTPLSDGERFAVGSDRTYLRWRTTADCVIEVAGHDVRAGSASWTAVVRPPERDVADPCFAWVPQVAAGALVSATSEGRPQAIDLASGRVRWSGDDGTVPLATVGDLLVTHHTSQRGIAGYDLRTGERRWVSELPADGDGGPERVQRAVPAGGWLGYQTTYRPDEGPQRELTWARDAGTGLVEWVGAGSNELLGGGSGVLVTRGRWIAGEPPVDHSQIQIRLFTR